MNLIDEPGPPGTPECASRDRDHIEVKWSPPRNDGGNPVQGYIVERREKSGKKKEWTKINRGELHKVNFVHPKAIEQFLNYEISREIIFSMKMSQL